MKKTLFILILTSILTGCLQEEGLDIPFMESSEISLTWKGTRQVTYDSQTCQLAYNDAKNEFRVYDDKLADWFIIRCDKNPTEEGQVVTADVSWTGDRNYKVFNAQSFIVRKISDDGHVWLWNSRREIGIIIKHIQ